MSIFVICNLITIIVRFTLNKFGYPNLLKKFCINCSLFGFRVLAFGFGHIYIHVSGEIDPDARIIISNHTAYVDPYIIMCIRYVTCCMKKELSQVKLLQYIFQNVDPVFVDRSVPSGGSKKIIEHANDPNLFPVLIYPEGTITNGDILLDFHHSAFLTEHKVQPMTVRYWMPMVPKHWNTYAWTTQPFHLYLWMMFSMPPTFLNVHILPSITKAVEGKGDSTIFAKQAQLIIANDLKVRACTRNSNEIFRKHQHKSSSEPNSDSQPEKNESQTNKPKIE